VPKEYHEYANDKLQGYLAFGAGPRNCIGRNLAYFEMQIVLAKLFWNFDIKLADDVTSQEWIKRPYSLFSQHSLPAFITPVES
jgi:cytochrome P450